MNIIISTIFWFGIYLALILAPLLVLLIGPVPSGSGFWWDLSMALGFAGLAMMGAQFLLTARFRRVSAPYGIDIIFYFHRYLGIIAFCLILVHYLIIRIQYPTALGSADPIAASWHMTAGRVAIFAFAIILVTSLFRKPLGIEYDYWRILHVFLATTGILLAFGHIQGAGYYIGAPGNRLLWAIYILFWMLLIVYVRVIKPWRMIKKPYRITNMRKELTDVWTLTLKAQGHAGIRFQPGQFAWLTLRHSPFHVQEHPFSISSSAEQVGKLGFTIKELGDFTRTIKNLERGETVYLDGPHGVFTVDRYPQAPGIGFIAGGVGIAPIMSMLRTLADRGDPRPLLLVYAANRWEDVIFAEALDAMKTQLNLRIIYVLAGPPDTWQGERGYVTPELLAKVLSKECNGWEYFLCGPKPMSKAAQRGLHALGVPLKQVHNELYDLV